MTTTKQERVERLLKELIDNLDNIQYWITQYNYNRSPESEDNSDVLYIMTHYAEAVEATFRTIKVDGMITPADGKYCPHCHGYVNPWVVRSMIAKGDETFRCRDCDYTSYIEDLIDADVVQ